MATPLNPVAGREPRAFRARLGSPGLILPTRRTLRTLVGDYAAWLEATGYEVATVRGRRMLLRGFVHWAEESGVHRPGQLSIELLEAYQLVLARERRRDGGLLSPGTQALVLTALRQFGKWLVRGRMIPVNPAQDLILPRRPRRLPRVVLTHEEMERVLAGPDVGWPQGLRNRAMLETLYSTGIRRMELIRLALGDLDPARGVALIREGKGRRDRVVPVGARALHWIGRYLVESRRRLLRAQPDPGSLFITARGHRFRANRMSELVRDCVRAAGVGKTGSCHLFRHSMATLLLENGADLRVVQEILGHAHLASTALYTHVAIGRVKQVHAATHPAEHGFRPPSQADQLELGLGWDRRRPGLL